MEGNNSGLGLGKKAARGSWTMAQKQQAVAESNVTGANVAEVAKRHGMRPALLSISIICVNYFSNFSQQPEFVAMGDQH